MKYYFSYLLIISIFFSCFFTCICPYPFFLGSGNLTSQQQKILNDANEYENYITSSQSKIAVVSLDWFETVNNIFPKFQNTRVIDVLTKTSYIVQRTGGHYHSDVEPIDKINKDKFFGIYNYEWSWNRRPVWVEINGMWVAGSINGMPHGYSLITDNDQNGHSCIHFLNSKTHGTKRVDEAHQSAIKYAIEHSSEIKKVVF